MTRYTKAAKIKRKINHAGFRNGIDKDIKSLYYFIPYVLEARGKIRHIEQIQGRHFKQQNTQIEVLEIKIQYQRQKYIQ